MKKRSTKKSQPKGPSLLELLDQVEAEMTRLREENLRLSKPVVEKPKPAAAREKPTVKPAALGKGLSQLFGGPRRNAPEPKES